jgi:hypothetical protein
MMRVAVVRDGGVGRMGRRAVGGLLGEGRIRSLVVLAVVLATALVVVSVTSRAEAATAGTSYGYLATFGSGDTIATGGTSLSGVAVEPGTGNIALGDPFNARAVVYAPDAILGGTQLTTISSSTNLLTNVAFDPSDGSVYVMDTFNGGIFKYTSDGLPMPTYTLDPSFTLAPGVINDINGALAVDATTHDLLVTDPVFGTVDRFSATGALLSSFNGSDISDGPLQIPQSLAVGPTGTTYVVDVGLPRLERFSPSGVSLGKISVTGQLVAVAANPATGDIVVVVRSQGRIKLEGFTATGQPTFTTLVPMASGGSFHGVAVDGVSGRIYMATDSGVSAFAPGTQPGVDPPSASQLATSSVHVSANVAPGGQATHARFEYCPASAACDDFPASVSRDLADPDYDPGSDPSNPSYNASTANPWVRGPDHAGLSGVGQVAIDDDLSGLGPNTSYKVRTYAANALVENVSASTTFTTLVARPVVQTGDAADVTESSTEVSGTIDTFGAQTTYHFDYGPSTDYGSTVPSGAEAIAGNGRTPRTFVRTIAGLQAGATYHYRLVATNSAGTSFGADQTFTTVAAGASPSVRGYEQVSPVDKKGAVINPLFGFQGKDDGSAVEYSTVSSPSDGPSAVQIARFMSSRGSTDWLDWNPLDPPLDVGSNILSSVTLAVSDDFTHTLVASNRAIVDGAISKAANLYVVDVATGNYTLVGVSTAPGAFNDMSGPRQTNLFLSGAPDFSWVVFVSKPPLLPGVTGAAMYKWSAADGLVLESRLPDGNIPAGNVWIQDQQVLSTREVSGDGATVYFTLRSGEVGVYRRTGGQTTAISVSHRVGDPSTPQAGQIDGVSRDGRYAIFHSGQLTADAPSAGSDNLYQYDASDGSLKYIGTLTGSALPFNVLGVSDDAQTVYFNDGQDTSVWRNGVIHAAVVGAHPEPYAFPSSNGRYLAYQGSDGNARLYDADTGQSSCMSCVPGGSAVGDANLTEADRNISNRLPRVVSDTGQAFFDTTARLVSADHNGTRDVYGFRDGRVTLISPGDGNFDARFADASADGRDVFFVTAEGLVSQDTDEATDVYDARVGGGFPGQSPAPVTTCAKTDCAEAVPGPVTSPPVGSSPQPSSAPAKRSNQERVQLSLGKVQFTATSVHISFRASQRGRVRVTGSRVSTTVRNVTKAGTYSIVVPLSKTARSLSRAHRKFKVSVKVSLSGGWGSASAKYSRTLGN